MFIESLPGDLDETDFCMTNQNGKWILKRNHMHITTKFNYSWKYVNFHIVILLWTEKDFVVERIAADKQFFTSVIDTVQLFMKSCRKL